MKVGHLATGGSFGLVTTLRGTCFASSQVSMKLRPWYTGHPQSSSCWGGTLSCFGLFCEENCYGSELHDLHSVF